MRLHQAIREAKIGGGVPPKRLIIDVGRPGILVVWDWTGEVRTLLRPYQPAEQEREAS